MTEIPVYRLALEDKSHPMHNIAKDVFRKKFDANAVAQKYADQRDEILPFLYAILDADELYPERSLGDGFAPINAVSLLGPWQVVEAIPRLLDLVDEGDYEAIVTDRAAFVLEQMPPKAIEPLLEYGKRDEKRAMNAMFVLTHVGKGDDRCFAFICNVFDRMTDDFDIITVAECLMVNNPDRAKKFLRKRSKTSRYRRFRSDFEKIIAKFKRGVWD